MRMLVVGAGSTGGYFGGRLAQAGRDVTFLVRPARAKRLSASGLQVKSPHGDFTLKPQLVTAGHIERPFDAVLLTVKAYGLEQALEDMAPAVGPQTMVLPVLNGMRHVDLLVERFGAKVVVGCACKIASFIDDEGRIVQMTPLQDIVYGEMDGTVSPRIRDLDVFMKRAGFDAKLSETIAREMWEKWVMLASMGGITCLMRGTIGDIEAAPGGTEFALKFLDEVVAVVRAAGVAPSEPFLTATRAMLTAKGSPQATSMYRDLQKGNPIEADQIIGDLLARGQKAEVATPLLAAAYTNLSVYQNRVAAKG